MPTPTHRSSRTDLIDLMGGFIQVVGTHGHSPRDDVDVAHEKGDHALDLVLFDMDGTLVSGVSSWELVHEGLGVDNGANWERYQRGEIDDQEFMRRDIDLWRAGGRRVHVRDVEQHLASAPLMPHAKELVSEIKRRGIATCILSGGLDVLAHRVCEETGIDMYVANGLALDADGYVAGDGLCYVRINGKGPATKDLLAKLGVARRRVAAIGNSEWDGPMFKESGFGVAFCPVDDGVRAAADVVVEGDDMMDVLPHLLAYRP